MSYGIPRDLALQMIYEIRSSVTESLYSPLVSVCETQQLPICVGFRYRSTLMCQLKDFPNMNNVLESHRDAMFIARCKAPL